jgi:hypothetical protein
MVFEGQKLFIKQNSRIFTNQMIESIFMDITSPCLGSTVIMSVFSVANCTGLSFVVFSPKQTSHTCLCSHSDTIEVL